MGALGARLEEAIRNLSDAELDRSAAFGPAGGRLLPTEQLAAVSARHIHEHRANARGVVAGDY
jgi:hypothetical protein